MSLPSVANGKPPTVKSPQLNLPGNDYVESIKQEIKNLESEDEVIVIKASASIFMLAAHAEALTLLPNAIPPLISLLNSKNKNIQKNAIATLTSFMQLDESLFKCILSSADVVDGLVQILHSKNNDESSSRLNAAAALAAIASGGMEGIEKILNAKGEYAIMEGMVIDGDEKEMEAMVDAFCAIAVNSNDRSSFILMGSIQKLLSMLLSYSSHEICVRILLTLGVLMGASNEAQEILINFDGGLIRLIELSKSIDSDVKSIASDLLLSLSRNEFSKPLLQVRFKEIAEAKRT